MKNLTESELVRRLATLRTREAAAVKLTAGHTTIPTKRSDLAAKLPETERAQLQAVRKWETRHQIRPSDFTHAKLDKARARLANTQRQLAKLALHPFIKELAEIRTAILEVEHSIEREQYLTEQQASEKYREQGVVLTERYDIDSITGVITKRANGMPVKSATIMLKGDRISLDKARALLMAGALA